MRWHLPRFPLFSLLFACCCFAPAPGQTPALPADQQDPRPQHAQVETEAASTLEQFVAERIGEPQIVEVTDGVLLAVGFDLANVVVIATDEGIVVVDTGSCSPRAEEIRAALAAYDLGPVRAVIYTHGEIEQVGGADAWVVDGETEIWGHERLQEQFLRQCILMQHCELRRGIRQFGLYLAPEQRTPSALGRLPELSHLARLPNVRMPQRTVAAVESFTLGGLEFQLFAAPGASPDHLGVWIPSKGVLACGDNFMRGFPELSRLRGNPQRSVDAWLASLDQMRSLSPVHLIAARHLPVSGQAEVERALIDYRDAIQWVRDATLRGIKNGATPRELAAAIELPGHLVRSPYLDQRTASLAGAVRAVYGEYAGWFDESVGSLLPLPDDAARREIELMGGPAAVFEAAEQARAEGDAGWAAHLLDKLRASGLDQHEAAPISGQQVRQELAASLQEVAAQTVDSSARSYLASLADELREPPPALEAWPCPSDETIRQLPLDAFFDRMALQLKVEETLDRHEVIWVNITDEETLYVISIRHGLLEVREGGPLPGTPDPSAIVSSDGLTWRKMCMGVANPAVEIVRKRVTIQGSARAVREFVACFECDARFERHPEEAAVLTSASARSSASAPSSNSSKRR